MRRTISHIGALILLRGQWQVWPNVGTFLLFLVGMIILVPWVLNRLYGKVPDKTKRKSELRMFSVMLVLIGVSAGFIGLLCNSLVVLTNGGFMPGTSINHSVSIWVTGTGHRLLFLGDNYGGFSIGDFLLLTGIGTLLIPPLRRSF